MKYSFKNILVGFRYEYLNIRNQLNEIENKIKIIDKELSKCIVLLNNETNNIDCYFISKEKEIIDAIINIENHLGLPIFNLNNLEYDSSINYVYHLKNNLLHYHVIIENLKEFNNNLLNIFNSNFINNMKSSYIETKDKDSIYNLEFDYNSLKQEKVDKNSIIKRINYYPNKDFLKVDYSNTLSCDILNNELNILYDSNNFNDYQKSLIEKYNKDIVLYDENIDNHEFKIEEDDNKIILIKR